MRPETGCSGTRPARAGQVRRGRPDPTGRRARRSAPGPPRVAGGSPASTGRVIDPAGGEVSRVLRVPTLLNAGGYLAVAEPAGWTGDTVGR